MLNELRGTGVALVTPFKDDHSIDYDAYQKLIAYTGNGVDYFVVQGTTGESVTVNESEKVKLLKIINELGTGKPIMFGIGGNNTESVLKSMDTYSPDHFDYVLSVCPYYNKPSQKGLINHFSTIADKSPKPVILYNVPGRTGINLTAESTVILSHHENIAGIKEASGDFAQAIHIVKNCREGFALISGDDLTTVPLISIGAIGLISVLANALPEIMGSMVKSALKGDYDMANILLHKILEINPLMYAEGNPTGVKVILEHKGICKKTVRLPLAEASHELEERIKKLI